jgi:hypothetical protein
MNEQDRWDAEDSVAFRKKLRSLRQALDKAREAEVKAMTTYHAAKKARQQAQVEIEAAIEADARPLPLFDNLPHQDDVIDAEYTVVPDPPEVDHPKCEHCGQRDHGGWCKPVGDEPPHGAKGLLNSGVTYKALNAAYVGDKFSRDAKQPPKVKPLKLDGRLWVSVGGLMQYGWLEYDVLPLHTLPAFSRQFPVKRLKQNPGVSDHATDEERKDYYAGVLVSYDGQQYAIGWSYERRTLLIREPAEPEPVIEKDLEKVLEQEADADVETKKPHRLDGVKIAVLGLPAFVAKKLRAAGITNVGHLVDLAGIRGEPLAEAIKNRFVDSGFDVGVPELIAQRTIDYLTANKPEHRMGERRCLACGCTEADCSRCIAIMGRGCAWSDTDITRCTACFPDPAKGVG